MTTLMAGHCADVREAASYAPKEAMPMSTEEAIQVVQDIRMRFMGTDADALTIALNAMRAQSEPGPQRDYEAEIERLTKQRDASEAARCETVNDYRDATERAVTLERALRLALDALDDKEAGL